MGITINDTITLDSGLSTSTGYGSFFKSSIYVEKEITDGAVPADMNASTITESGNVVIRANGHLWASKGARDGNKSIIRVDNIQTIVTLSSFVSTSIYTLLYDAWKQQYSSVSDAI
tara:strand:+ start:641 stop:988 length:348 start_codon:yes stop_codon:yes gene_type:complete